MSAVYSTRMLALLLLLQQTTTEESTLPVRPVSGTLSVWRASAGRAEPAGKQTRVAPADLLGTSDGSPARFETEGALRVLMRGIRVAADKGLSVRRDGTRIVLRLLKGTVVVESYESEVELDTPAGKVRGKDVCFVATADEKSTRVLAIEGTVTFTSDLGAPAVAVPEGRSLEGEKGKAPGAPRAAAPAELEAARAQEADLNLLRNPGFENHLEEWGAADGLDVQSELKTVHSGKRSVRVVLKDWRANDPILPSRTVRGVLKPGTKYFLRFYVRTEGYVGPAGPALFKFGLDRTGKGVTRDSSTHWELPGSEGQWSARRVVFEATTPDLWMGFFAPTAGGPFQGSLWFDDFLLAELPSRPR
jgi:hypothetical protein